MRNLPKLHCLFKKGSIKDTAFFVLFDTIIKDFFKLFLYQPKLQVYRTGQQPLQLV